MHRIRIVDQENLLQLASLQGNSLDSPPRLPFRSNSTRRGVYVDSPCKTRPGEPSTKV